MADWCVISTPVGIHSESKIFAVDSRLNGNDVDIYKSEMHPAPLKGSKSSSIFVVRIVQDGTRFRKEMPSPGSNRVVTKE